MKPTIGIVVHVAREYGNLIGSGGVKDATRGLSLASAKKGIQTHIFIPFPKNEIELRKLALTEAPIVFEIRMDYSQECKRTEQVTVYHYHDPYQVNLRFHFVQAKRFAYLSEGNRSIERRGVYTYTEGEASLIGRPDLYGKRYHDSFEMNVLLIKATLRALERYKLKPDLIHCHDGHTAFLPFIAQNSVDEFAYFLQDAPTLITIYNAADRYRSEIVYDKFVPIICGIHDYLFEACLHNGQFDPILAAGLSGTMLNTVSENYARELQETGLDWTTDWLGHRLAGYGIKIVGITSGIDTGDFNPLAPDKMGLAAGFAPQHNDFEGKKSCKQALLAECNFKNASEQTPLLTFVGRLVHQKGYDTLAKAIRELFQKNEAVLLVGNGNGHQDVVRELKVLEAEFRGRISIDVSYDTKKANRVLAGGDFCLIPSRYEPCGVVDFIAQLYGNIPIVHAVGGLVKVLDGQTGFTYRGGAPELLQTIRKAIDIYQCNKALLRKMQLKAVTNIFDHFTWEQVFNNKYFPLYQEVIEKAMPRLPYESLS